ncbi:STAS domain-containing protein [Chitiniphilus purpureus]|uniref:STAS domain-containing protein n=1 Tax=Chitiniphilus purpureus TaxID=2981137 RepID=A0ABY6DLU0_9NEIS|nr:STAS domain-containing protein [Chitiniphilus sp. CD1]UXY15316.1 STAS domain-containing protein [Chitiniphilus sp. CD1]
MFSFFRKKDNEAEKPEAPASARKPTPAPSVPAAPAGEPPAYDLSDLSIEVEDIGAHLSPAEEEAVVLYANNQAEAAVTALKAALPGVLGTRRHETWGMLFELYQQLGDRPAFDDLALQFVVEFEVSPPVWRDLPKAAPAQTGAAGGAYVNFPAQLKSDGADREAAKLVKACEGGGPVRVDFSRVTEIESLAAAELLAAWARARKARSPLQLLGSENFIELLRSKIEPGRKVPSEAPFWLLLLEVMQSTGEQEAFDNLAIVYAVTFEVSPPSWDTKLTQGAAPKPAPAPKPAKAAAKTSAPDHLPLSGEITGGAKGLAPIREFASKHAKPVLDFKAVSRIDFETAGQLLNLCMELIQQGHGLVIQDANDLVAGLLHLLGVSELVELRYSHPRH